MAAHEASTPSPSNPLLLKCQQKNGAAMTAAWWFGLIFYSLICALGGGLILSSKNRSYLQCFLLGLFFGLIGLIITVGIAPQEVPRAAPVPIVPGGAATTTGTDGVGRYAQRGPS
jgi:hypothetical protein